MHLWIALQTLREYQLVVKLSKCEFWVFEVVFLCHVVSSIGISVDLTKVEVVLKQERPRSTSEIQSLLGLAWYY